MELPQGVRRYRKGREIGKSLYGAVRYGLDIVLNKWVVIKECNIERVAEKRTTKGLFVDEDVNMEIELLRRLSEDEDRSPYLVRFLDVCQDATYIYVILEYIECGDMFSCVKTSLSKIQHIMSPQKKRQELQIWHQKVRKWIKQVLLCLKFMHERNICHRDISLENTMLDKENNAKVIDLGVAHCYEDGNFTTEKGKIGKTQYMSPECLKDQYYDGRANDIWCVGVMLWICLIGSPPWELASSSNPKDQRFVFVMRGLSGVVGLMTMWKKRDMCPDSAANLLARIFRPQKDRIRIDEALKHPFFTGRDCAVDHYIAVPTKKYLPDLSLSEKWHLFRDSGVNLVTRPSIFARLPQNKKDEIQKFIWKKDKIAGGIFDQRITNEMCYSFSMDMADVHEVIIFYMAASRGFLKFQEAPSKSIENKEFHIKPRGYAVDEEKEIKVEQEKEVEPIWFLELEKTKRWNLLQTFTEWSERGGLQTARNKEKLVEHLKLNFGLTRAQCQQLWKHLGILDNQPENVAKDRVQRKDIISRELNTKFGLSDALCLKIWTHFDEIKQTANPPVGGAVNLYHCKEKLVKELDRKFSLGETKCRAILEHIIEMG